MTAGPGERTAGRRAAVPAGARAHEERVRLRWLGAAAILVAALVVGAVSGGWNLGGWLHEVWHSFGSVSYAYIVPVLVLQTLHQLLSAYAWFRILGYAFPGRVRPLHVLACYSAGVALNGFLPASAGTLVTLLMLVAVIESATFSGIVGSAAVEKLFWVLQAVLLWVILFLSVGGTFAMKFGSESRHPWFTTLVIGALVAVVAVVLRLAWPRLRRVWEQAKHGGKILGDRRAYVRGVLVPQLLSWWCRVAAVAVLLVAYGIPVNFQRVMYVIGGNTLGSTVSVTPGGVGVNQALSVVSLHGATTPATAAAYSVGQQVLTTGWNLVLAIVFVAAAFGWAGGRQLVKQSLGGAYERLEERRTGQRQPDAPA